jgi:hypothetical protein
MGVIIDDIHKAPSPFYSFLKRLVIIPTPLCALIELSYLKLVLKSYAHETSFDVWSIIS